MEDLTVHTVDEWPVAVRRREVALNAAVVLLQNYSPTSGKTRAGVTLDIAKQFEQYLANG